MLHCYTIFYYTILCYAVLDGTILPHGKATLGKASKLRPDKPVGILLDTKANEIMEEVKCEEEVKKKDSVAFFVHMVLHFCTTSGGLPASETQEAAG